MSNTQTQILNSLQIEQIVDRLAYQIYEDCFEDQQIILIGIKPNGYVLADRLQKKLQDIGSLKVQLCELHIEKENPLGKNISIKPEVDFSNASIVLVDDVLNSGKTLFYAFEPFLNVPVKKLRTVVLVDRNHKRYPVSADFSGFTLATTMQEHISVTFDENSVFLI